MFSWCLLYSFVLARYLNVFFFFSSRRRHTRYWRDWSSDVCSSDLASAPNRVSLPDIRKGEYEGMKEKMLLPEWAPDFGERAPHPTAGVTAVGCRMPLIAFNINLDTADVEIAKKIAKAIRFSSGGFRHIQAGPAEIKEKGFVQVTMNIKDFKKNPIYRVFETVKMEAKRYGVNVTGSEIIGAVPMEAIVESLAYYLGVEDLGMNKILESKLIK